MTILVKTMSHLHYKMLKNLAYSITYVGIPYLIRGGVFDTATVLRREYPDTLWILLYLWVKKRPLRLWRDAEHMPFCLSLLDLEVA